MRRILLVLLLGIAAVAIMAAADADLSGYRKGESYPPPSGSVPAGPKGEESGRAVASSLKDPPVQTQEAPGSLPDLSPVAIPFAELSRLIPEHDGLAGGAAYRVAEGKWNDAPQKIHVLTVDPAAAGIRLVPVLSFDRLFGFEPLSVMAERVGALAAVNGGFAYTDGRPAGIVLIDGRLLHPSDSRFPSLFIGKDSASLGYLETEVSIMREGTPFHADFLNPWPMRSGIAVFTPAYGNTDRVEGVHLVARVSDGRIRFVREVSGPSPVPEDGFLIAASGRDAVAKLLALCEEGQSASLEISYLPALPPGTLHTMSCGSFLIQDGREVVPEQDPWVGSLHGRAPRTVVGIGAQGQLVFIVAEGRIPQGPSGLSGKELGELLVGMGLEEAALLDGGASSELIVDKRIVNRLSADRERILPTGFILLPRERQ